MKTDAVREPARAREGPARAGHRNLVRWGVIALWCLAAGVAAARPPGLPPVADLAEGQRVFELKGCDRCHTGRGEAARQVTPREALRVPRGLGRFAGHLWNNFPAMRALMAEEGILWPKFQEPEMEDLLAFLRVDAGLDRPPNPQGGMFLLVRKGCLTCHTLAGGGGARGLIGDPHRETPAAWVAALWNFAPRMMREMQTAGVPYPAFDGAEMGDLLAYLLRRANRDLVTR